MSNTLFLLSYLFIGLFLERVVSLYPYIPQHYFGVPIDYKYYNQYGNKGILQLLNEGQTVDTFDEVMLDTFLNQSAVCDISRQATSKKEVVYMPSVCTKECTKPTELGKYTNTSCIDRYPGEGICCPASNDQWYQERFPNVRNYQWREMRKPRFHPHTIMMGSERNRTVFDDYETLNDPDMKKALSQELVCGIRAKRVFRPLFSKDDDIVYDYEYIPFVCVEPGRCNDGNNDHADLNPRPEWHQFCQYNLWYQGRATVNPTKTRCCHTAFLPSGHFPKTLHSWRLPQLPFYMKYAPGVRSNYACEKYAQFICENGLDTCLKQQPKYGHKVNEKEFPHVVRLGVIAPKVMLFHCLGSIISRRYILSAWSCRTIHGIDTNIVLVGDDGKPQLIDNHYREELYVITEVHNVYLEWENPKKTTGRIWEPAVYRTSEDIQFNAYIRPACLYYKPENRQSKGIFVGLSNNFHEDDGSPLPDGYRRSELPIEGTNDLNCYTKPPYDDAYPNYAAILRPKDNQYTQDYHTFCAGDSSLPAKHGPCQWDLGGSMVVEMDKPYCQWQIIGVLASHRHNCSRFEHAVFQNITMFVEAIENIVWPLLFLDFDNTRPSCGHFSGSFWRESWDEHGDK